LAEERWFAVVGLGRFGMSLALELGALGEKVIAVDLDPDRARSAQQVIDQAVVADATDRQTLHAIGLERVQAAVVSLGGDLDASILAVLHLTKLGIPQIIAKALTEDHAEILTRVGATRIVFPERETGFRLAERLSSPNVLDSLVLSAELSVVELAPPKAFVGKTLAELHLGREYGVQVLAIHELVPEQVILVPPAGQVVKDSDILIVMGKDEGLRALREA
jgi:trk system potassium uptake protein